MACSYIYNILDFASINSWILFKCVIGTKISRCNFIESLAEEMREECIKKPSEKRGKKGEIHATKTLSKHKNHKVKNINGNVADKMRSSCTRVV